jgi:hypothetical protein
MNPDILILKHHVRALLTTLAVVSDDGVLLIRKLAAALPLAEQPAALELAAKHKATMDTQIAAARVSLERIES